jgi:hypothetical protein
MSPHVYSVEGARTKKVLADLIKNDPEIGSKSSRVLNILTQTPEEEILPVINKILDLGLSPKQAAQAISSFESNIFPNFRPVPWDEIHHMRGLDIFTSVRDLPVEEQPKALDLMHQSGRTLGDTAENLSGTSFDVRTHTGANLKATLMIGGERVKARDVLDLNAPVKELSAHPFGTKETRPGIIVPQYDNAGDWFEHAAKSADAVKIDADRGIAIEQPRRQVVNNILQSGRGAPPISSFDIFHGTPEEVRAANKYLSAPEQQKALAAIYKSWDIPKNLDPSLLPAGTTPELAQKLAQYFPEDMLAQYNFNAGLPGFGSKLGQLIKKNAGGAVGGLGTGLMFDKDLHNAVSNKDPLKVATHLGTEAVMGAGTQAAIKALPGAVGARVAAAMNPVGALMMVLSLGGDTDQTKNKSHLRSKFAAARYENLARIRNDPRFADPAKPPAKPTSASRPTSRFAGARDANLARIRNDPRFAAPKPPKPPARSKPIGNNGPSRPNSKPIGNGKGGVSKPVGGKPKPANKPTNKPLNLGNEARYWGRRLLGIRF